MEHLACGVTMDVFATGHLYQRKAAGISAPDLIQTSLALAVFVELDYLCAENSLEIEGPRIRPYTLHAILSLIELMNNHPDHADPSYVDAITGDLDVTQKILHSFSSVIPWTWSACHKMGSEPNNVILSATLVWLHCSQIPSKQDRTNVFTLCSETARKDLLINPLASSSRASNLKHEA
ncbi:hypothetical protein SISSUDRAFT_14563 [Sistotremastrum suecicum HHB10207 ss-3]|uniref:Uncharacterized protein n=1 Tax=Sistotremastrum suecicum HHB10207 ss-3 TaxID=1314776 RepID=A0A166J5Y3_9AGAM|nr:hypothetical protein SISSUDRAFT_14563 [Sistotremastrum suecicum HHB10207 ss-3]